MKNDARLARPHVTRWRKKEKLAPISTWVILYYKLVQSESSSPDSLKHKKSELRLYCDLLMQQAHMVKEAACKEKPPDVQKLEEATTLLSATCDSFIETLEACSKLANENFQFEMPIQHTNEAVIPPTLAKTNKMPKPNASS